MTLLARALRLVLGGTLAWCVVLALGSPELPRACAIAAIAAFALTAWRPDAGLLLLTGVAPAGALLASAPIRATELLAWAFLSGWLLRLWRPLCEAGWPRGIVMPACLFLATLIASWLMLTTAGAAGVPLTALPGYLLQSLPSDHLIFSSPAPETWTLLQTVAGIAVFLAALAITRNDSGTAATVARALALSVSILAIGTVAEVARQWGRAGYGGWFLERYVNGERFSFHLGDLNAAASLYVLGGLAAVALAVYDRPLRRMWMPLVTLILPALWLAGSRTAAAAGALAGALAIPHASRQRHSWPTRAVVAAAATVLVIGAVAAAVIASRESDETGTVAQSLFLRSEFHQTTLRMFASSPVFGVGVGKYFDRSAEFMSDRLRAIFGNENAHNYFAQQFAEIGLIGGLLFLWLIVPPLARGWRHIWSGPEGDGAVIGLVAGTTGYLLTCLTGHPLLVPEAALPFWAAFGAVAAVASGEAAPRRHARIAAVAVGVVLAAGMGRVALRYSDSPSAPPERGFHGFETAEDGTRFRWMTRHAVAFTSPGPGFVSFQLRAPDQPQPRPLVIELAIDGRVVGRREVQPGRWTNVELGVREAGTSPVRRIDLRANQFWSQEVALGRREAQRPISAMVSEIAWTPLAP